VIDTIAWGFQTESQWIHLPERYGNWLGVYNRLRMRAADGTWERVFPALLAQTDEEDDLDWVVSVEATELFPTWRLSTSVGLTGRRSPW
jgi:transposase